ncbi:hypothetical protein ABZ722_31795 [Streptomyces longwoodensis]|uniref:hypothetical protein n=1 Tax=Streptomyces longwoodensis TaxID=68231 RepID=UPI0034000E96
MRPTLRIRMLSAATAAAFGALSLSGAVTTARADTPPADPTRPGSPGITDASGYACGDAASPASYRIGTAAGFTLSSAPSGGPAARYSYQLNGAVPLSVANAGSSTGIHVTPDSGMNTLTVTAIAADGAIGGSTDCHFSAAPPPTAPDGDLTGDGLPDLTVVGAQAGLPSGLWLARGTADGQLDPDVTDLGEQGTGANSAGSATDWDGTQAITGHFHTGAGFNDVLVYAPARGTGAILYGNGDGSPLSPYSGHEVNVRSSVFTDGSGVTGAPGSRATSIAGGGELYRTVNDSPRAGFPDLLMIVNGQLWDEPGLMVPGAFIGLDNALPLTSTNPTGSGDWTGWSLTSSLVDGLPALFARNAATGALYYYTPQQLQDLAYGNPVIPLKLADSGYDAAALPVLQAADLNSDGTPDLRTVSATGLSTAWILDPAAGTLTPRPAQNLNVPGGTA